MAALIHLDTHVVAWLYEGRVELFPRAVRARLEADDLWISPAVELELQFLHEVGRISEPALAVVAAVSRDLGLRVCTHPFREVEAGAVAQRWTRDPFGRVIVGQALAGEADLATKDRTIRKHYHRAIW